MNKQQFQYIYDANRRGVLHRLQVAASDVVEAVRLYRLWIHLSWRGEIGSTNRTYLGYSWNIFATMAQVIILGYVYGSLFSENPSTMMLYLSAGLSFWTFITTVFFNSFNIFINYRSFILARDTPLPMLIFCSIGGDFILLIAKLMSFAILSVIFLVPPNANTLLVIPGVAVLAVMAFPVKLFCATLGTRFRDLQFAFQPLSLAAFLITPVLWHRKFLETGSWVSEYNPFTHILEIVRAPLLGESPEPASYYVVLSLSVVVWSIAIPVYARYRNRVAVWL